MINPERIEQIDARLMEIRSAAEAPEADLGALKAEKDQLAEERAEINRQIEERKELLRKIANDQVESRTIEKAPEQRKEKTMDFANMTPDEIRSNEEYRIAWLKNLQGKKLTETEQRALTATSAMPEATANKIVDLMVDMVPLLNEIELFRIPGNINVSVETASPGATLEAAGGAVTESTATLRMVALGGYNMNAFIRVGADLSQMAIPAFEEWLTRKLAEGVAYKIEYYIINGDGNSAPKGIEYYASWDDSDGNAVDWDGSALDLGDLDQAIGNIPAAYDRGAKFLMSKKTFFQDVSGITDVNNLSVLKYENGKYYIRGYEVIFSDQVTLHDIFFGNFKKGMIGNLSSDVKVEKQRNLAYNAYDYLGWGVFDCEPAAAGCIVKIASDIAA